jgi:CheY-like chemotaxis protein
MTLRPYTVVVATVCSSVSDLLQRVVIDSHPTARVMRECDGLRALNTYSATGADLIFADYSLPALNGRELVRRVRLENPYVPIVMLSIDPRRQLPSLSAGASHFVVKPFPVTTIENMLTELLPLRTLAVGSVSDTTGGEAI